MDYQTFLKNNQENPYWNDILNTNYLLLDDKYNNLIKE